jgi:hypothetical protein
MQEVEMFDVDRVFSNSYGLSLIKLLKDNAFDVHGQKLDLRASKNIVDAVRGHKVKTTVRFRASNEFIAQARLLGAGLRIDRRAKLSHLFEDDAPTVATKDIYFRLCESIPVLNIEKGVEFVVPEGNALDKVYLVFPYNGEVNPDFFLSYNFVKKHPHLFIEFTQ